MKAPDVLRPDRIPLQYLNTWKKDEIWVARLLRLAKHMSDPNSIDDKLTKVLKPVDPPKSTYQTLLFLQTTKKRVEYLLSDKSRERLDSLRLGAFRYVESRILRKAVFEGVYLTAAS